MIFLSRYIKIISKEKSKINKEKRKSFKIDKVFLKLILSTEMLIILNNICLL